MNERRRIRAGILSLALVALALVTALVLACGSREPGEEQTHAPSPTPPAMSPTPHAGSPVASATQGTVAASPSPPVEDGPAVLPQVGAPIAAAGEASMPVIRLAIPACQAIPPSEAGSENSTAPFPTSTPLPPEDEGREDIAAALIWPALRDMSLIAGSLDSWSSAFDSRWSGAGTPEGQAALLQEFGARLQRLCTAASVLDAPYEVASLAEWLRRMLLERHAWALDGARALIAGTDPAATATRARWEVAIASMREWLISLRTTAERFPVTAGEISEAARPVRQPGGGVSLDVPDGWLVAENGLRTTVLAPVEKQQAGIDGLGPAQWGAGTALRLHRLRNPDGVTGPQVTDWAVSLLGAFGNVVDRREIILGGAEGTQVTLEQPGTAWRTLVALVDDGRMTLFVEFGCPSDVSEECAGMFNELTAGLDPRG